MNTPPDDARPPAVRHADIGEQAWHEAADAQLSARPHHSDFYALAGSLSPTLFSLMELTNVLRFQVAGYGEGRPVYDDTRTVDPALRLAHAADELAALRASLAAARGHAEGFWSEISHIGVEVTPVTAPTFDELFRAYQPWLIRYLSTHVRHGDRALADDLAQIAFLRVWRALPTARLESDAQQRAWLGTIARHVLADHYRANATRQRLREQSIDPGDVAAFDVDEADDHADRVSTLVDIARSMADAPADHRRVVALRLISETPWHQLAGMTRQGKAGVRRVLAEATAGVIA